MSNVPRRGAHVQRIPYADCTSLALIPLTRTTCFRSTPSRVFWAVQRDLRQGRRVNSSYDQRPSVTSTTVWLSCLKGFSVTAATVGRVSCVTRTLTNVASMPHHAMATVRVTTTTMGTRALRVQPVLREKGATKLLHQRWRQPLHHPLRQLLLYHRPHPQEILLRRRLLHHLRSLLKPLHPHEDRRLHPHLNPPLHLHRWSTVGMHLASRTVH